MTWGATWRRTYERQWNEWVQRADVSLRVLLPASSDADLVSHLARRFNKGQDVPTIESRISKAYYEGLQTSMGPRSTVEVRQITRAGEPEVPAFVAEHAITPSIVTGTSDLDEATFRRLASRRELSWDIETTGLDWANDLVCTVQICDGDTVVLLNRLSEQPHRLVKLLERGQTRKLFHHAMFDLRFMAASWGARPRNVSCTKLAAKLLEIPKPEQSLRPLLQRFLGIAIDKAQQTSDWTAESLSADQVRYAASDVVYLGDLASHLQSALEGVGRRELAEACFHHIPTRVQLDLARLPDVFEY